MAELVGLVTGEYGRPNAGEIMPMYSPDCAGNKDDALEQNIRDEIMGNKSDRAQAWDYHDVLSDGTYIYLAHSGGVMKSYTFSDLGANTLTDKKKLSVRYVRYRYAGVKGNAYMRLRHETAAIRGHYTHSRLMRAKQAIFVHRSGWDRRLVYGTSKMVSIERSKPVASMRSDIRTITREELAVIADKLAVAQLARLPIMVA